MTTLTDRAVHHEERAAHHLEVAEGGGSFEAALVRVGVAQVHATLALSLRTADQTAWARGRWGQ